MPERSTFDVADRTPRTGKDVNIGRIAKQAKSEALQRLSGRFVRGDVSIDGVVLL